MNNKLKILVVSNMYPSPEHPYFGRFVHAVVQGLSERFRTTVVGRKKEMRSNLFAKIASYLCWFIKALNLSLNYSYDVLYVHFVSRSSFPFVQLAKIRKKVTVVNFHGSDGYDQHVWNTFAYWSTRQSDLAVFPSQSFADRIVRKMGLDRNRVFISPSAGVDTKVFVPVSGEPSNSVTTFGYVSNIVEEKGIFLLIEAIRQIDQKLWSLTVIGSGPQLAFLKSRVSALGLGEAVAVKGALPHATLPNEFSKMDFFVFPTLRQKKESLGLVGLESLSSGVPVIGSNIPAIKDYIIDGFNGFLFDNGSVEGLERVLRHALAVPQKKRELMALNSRKTAMTYDSDVVLEELSAKLSECFENNGLRV